MLRGDVCDQLVGGAAHQRHRPGALHLRQLQETRSVRSSLQGLRENTSAVRRNRS